MTATKKTIPGKRIKTWFRHYRKSLGKHASLRSFARDLIASGTSAEKSIATKWAGGKVAA